MGWIQILLAIFSSTGFFQAGPGGNQKNPFVHIWTSGQTVSSTSKNIKDVMKYMDFFYTEKGRELTSWGKEGVTYSVENGKKKFLPQYQVDVLELIKKTGMKSDGTYTWIDYDSELSLSSEESRKAYIEARKYDDKLQPIPSFNQTELNKLATLGDNIRKHRDENMSKFIMGQKSMSEWDKYKEEANKLGVEQLVDMYAKAYDRILKIGK